MQENQYETLFFYVRVTMKERSTKRCLKRVCIFQVILVGLPTRLILFVQRLLTYDLNFSTGFFCQYIPLLSPLLSTNRQTSTSKLPQGFRQQKILNLNPLSLITPTLLILHYNILFILEPFLLSAKHFSCQNFSSSNI